MFLLNKYTKWYFSIIENAKNKNRTKKEQEYYESHHIIPKCMNGTEEVLLTAKEHFICHLLLCKMTDGTNRHKMINALIKMSFSESKNQKRYTSRSFSLVRSFIAQKNSEMFKGKQKSEKTKNNMKGHSGKWIRTEKYRKQASEKRKNKAPDWTLLSNDDPIKIEIIKKISKRMLIENPMNSEINKQKMIQTLKSKRWYTNGTHDVFTVSCPEGYYAGRSKNRKVKSNACSQK